MLISMSINLPKLRSLDQRQATSLLFIVLIAASVFITISEILRGNVTIRSLLPTTGAAIFISILYWFHGRRWKYSDVSLVVMVALLIGAALTEPNVSQAETLVVLLPAIIATLVAKRKGTIIGGTIIVIAVLLIRAGGQGIYTDPITLVLIALAVVSLVLSRLVLERSQQQVVDQVDQFQQITDSIDELFFLVQVDKSGMSEVLYLSPAVEKIWGKPVSSFLGVNPAWFESVFDEDKVNVQAAIERVIKDGQNEAVSFRIHHNNGSTRYIESNIFPVIDDKNRVVRYTGIARDVTGSGQLEQAQKDFMLLASHHLRTPLTGIKLSAEMLASGDLGKLNEAEKKYVNQIVEASKTSVDLVNKLLNIARAETGRLGVEPEPVNVNKAIQDELDNLAEKAKQNKLSIVFDEGDLPVINLDRKQLSAICASLLSNAILYSKNKGHITVTTKKTGNKISLRVGDDGLGIPKEEQERVFSRFYRGSNVERLGPVGHGLGLYLTKIIVEQLAGGTISFISAENEGTTFTVELPATDLPKKAGEPYDFDEAR
jgi:PAS domain S-box-containing protein